MGPTRSARLFLKPLPAPFCCRIGSNGLPGAISFSTTTTETVRPSFCNHQTIMLGWCWGRYSNIWFENRIPVPTASASHNVKSPVRKPVGLGPSTSFPFFFLVWTAALTAPLPHHPRPICLTNEWPNAPTNKTTKPGGRATPETKYQTLSRKQPAAGCPESPAAFLLFGQSSVFATHNALAGKRAGKNSVGKGFRTAVGVPRFEIMGTFLGLRPGCKTVKSRARPVGKWGAQWWGGGAGGASVASWFWAVGWPPGGSVRALEKASLCLSGGVGGWGNALCWRNNEDHAGWGLETRPKPQLLPLPPVTQLWLRVPLGANATGPIDPPSAAGNFLPPRSGVPGRSRPDGGGRKHYALSDIKKTTSLDPVPCLVWKRATRALAPPKNTMSEIFGLFVPVWVVGGGVGARTPAGTPGLKMGNFWPLA